MAKGRHARHGKEKIVRDIVFGYVTLQAWDVRIIDTPVFQRLKRIGQLTAFSLYPSANHTRFEHSLGVMDLGVRVFRNLEANSDVQSIADVAGTSIERLRDTVRYACLLHDVGHAAFSHVGERFYDKQSILESIKAENEGIYEAIGGTNAKGDAHELMSCLVILKHYAEQLPREVDIELACRMIAKAEYSLNDPRKALNPVIEILNSPYDVDRLDYVLRDSKTTGTFGVSIDYERTVTGYAIRDEKLLFLRKAIPCVVNLITGRDFLYQWLYNHHTVAYTDMLVEKTLRQYFKRRKKQRLSCFSVQAIENGVDDHVVWRILRECRQKGIGQAWRLFERKFHKALWKTPYDFDTCHDLTRPKKARLLDLLKEQGRLSDQPRLDAFLNQVSAKLGGVAEGGILISMHAVKHFDPVANRQVYFWLNEEAVEYGRLCGASPFAAGSIDYPLVFFDPSETDREQLIAAIDAAL